MFFLFLWPCLGKFLYKFSLRPPLLLNVDPPVLPGFQMLGNTSFTKDEVTLLSESCKTGGILSAPFSPPPKNFQIVLNVTWSENQTFDLMWTTSPLKNGLVIRFRTRDAFVHVQGNDSRILGTCDVRFKSSESIVFMYNLSVVSLEIGSKKCFSAPLNLGVRPRYLSFQSEGKNDAFLKSMEVHDTTKKSPKFWKKFFQPKEDDALKKLQTDVTAIYTMLKSMQMQSTIKDRNIHNALDSIKAKVPEKKSFHFWPVLLTLVFCQLLFNAVFFLYSRKRNKIFL